ncbi:unnamed protein product [marine sediment metagenome]|uniref:Uncharacterized protein n=1 Tax=marine sediment metagenome TaxID=412755 RepID=X1A9P4_9ZZZZ
MKLTHKEKVLLRNIIIENEPLFYTQTALKKYDDKQLRTLAKEIIRKFKLLLIIPCLRYL